MQTAKEIHSLDDLFKFFGSDKILTKHYGYDDRIEWETYLVLSQEGHPIGQTDGPMEDLIQMTSSTKPRVWTLGYDGDFDTTGVVKHESGPQIYDPVEVVAIEDIRPLFEALEVRLNADLSEIGLSEYVKINDAAKDALTRFREVFE